MIIYKDDDRKNAIKPIKFVRPILDEKGNSVQNMYISDDCELYDIDEWNSHDYFENTPQAPLRVNTDSHGRKYAAINDDSKNHKRTQHLARICRKAFDEPRKTEEFYKAHQVDHIDPSIPLDNNIRNLEWVSPQENMYRAGKTGVMFKKYSKELITEICKDMIKGLGNFEIADKYNVNVNLIYDISVGKSHRSVSEKLVKDGFVYKEPDERHMKDGRDSLAHRVCQMVKENPNITDTEVARIIYPDDKRKSQSFRTTVHNIRTGYTHKDIGKQYGLF